MFFPITPFSRLLIDIVYTGKYDLKLKMGLNVTKRWFLPTVTNHSETCQHIHVMYVQFMT